MAFSDELTNHIRMFCECDFPSSHIYQPDFKCFNESPDYTTFRAYLIALTDDWASDELVAAVENWVTSRKSVTVLGQVLQIDGQCPVAIPSLTISGCSTTEVSTLPTYVTVGSVISSCAVVIFLTSILVVCSVILKKYIYKR